MTEARRRRARETEHAVARYLQTNGFPYAEAVGAGRSGVDVTGTPGIALEVKARADFNPLAWMKQARGRVGLPVVVLRCNGQGEEAGAYAAIVPMDQLVALLRAAGYGDPLEQEAALSIETEAAVAVLDRLGVPTDLGRAKIRSEWLIPADEKISNIALMTAIEHRRLRLVKMLRNAKRELT